MSEFQGSSAADLTQRLDRWLWFARVFKSRSLASRSVANGQVRVTRAGTTQRVDKPAYMLKVGDIVTLRLRQSVRVLEVAAPGTRRGPAAEAQALYRDLSGPSGAGAGLPSAD